jgi:hypothetical protein
MTDVIVGRSDPIIFAALGAAKTEPRITLIKGSILVKCCSITDCGSIGNTLSFATVRYIIAAQDPAKHDKLMSRHVDIRTQRKAVF